VSVVSTSIKICCIASVDEARRAVDAGAAALGLVSAMPSGPGVIDDTTIAVIARALPPSVRSVLLTARTDADAIAEQHAAAGTTTLQLVDHVPAAELKRLRRRCPGVELMQVVHVTGPDSVDEAAAAAPWVDALLLDSGDPRLPVKRLGGTGRTHDWDLSRRIREIVAPRPLWLAGGLHAANAAQALEAVRPFGVDVCSGVRVDGRLDDARLAAFVAAVRGADLPA
jgi:phosphoribosylanthranilate isomerase